MLNLDVGEIVNEKNAMIYTTNLFINININNKFYAYEETISFSTFTDPLAVDNVGGKTQ